MALKHLSLTQIDENHLRRLIEGRAAETRDIDYKRETYGNGDKDHGEFLADISSFANAAGGDIVVGMAAKAGVPTGLEPLSGDVDAEINRLESIARSSLQPRIYGLEMRAVSITGGGSVIVIRVPRSYNPPHRIVRQGSGHHRFFARSSAGKFEPNVDELRLLFTQAPQLADKMRDFRFDRIAKITANDGPVPLLNTHALVLHVIPFSAFDSRLRLPLGEHNKFFNQFPPILSSHPSSLRVNVDGLLAISNTDANARQQRAYVQVYHSGIVEAVASSFLIGDGSQQKPYQLTALRVEASIVKYSHKYLHALLTLGCTPPFAILVSLIGVKDVPYSLSMGASVFEDEAGLLDRDQFHFSEVIVEDVPDDPYELANRLRPLLDQTSNAAGFAASSSFNTGRFNLKVD